MRLAAKLADRRMKTFWRRVCTFSSHHTVNAAKSSLHRGKYLLLPWVVFTGIFSLYKLYTVAAGLGWGRGCGPASWSSSPHLCSSSFSILVFVQFFSLSLPLLIPSHDIDTCPGHINCFLLSHLHWSSTLLPIVPPAPLFLSLCFFCFLKYFYLYLAALGLSCNIRALFLKKKSLILTQCCKSTMY